MGTVLLLFSLALLADFAIGALPASSDSQCCVHRGLQAVSVEVLPATGAEQLLADPIRFAALPAIRFFSH